MNELISQLQTELKKPLPGKEFQDKMAPIIRGDFNSGLPLRQAAVLILLYPDEDNLYTLFMKRSEYEGVHSGQISFPGGRLEDGDETLWSTALRETEEEIGVIRNSVSYIGELSSLHIPVSNNEVFPFVGFTDKKPVFISDPIEVEYLIEAELNYLTDPLIVRTKKMFIRDIEIDVPFFDIEGHHIWGATAMILNEFIEVVRKTFQKF